ncbi:serine hydrolase domain-containing protein [Nonomuraea endophytica]|uniref:CubicO group peptidase (Beta-lactamase class C family) n=1 Tax=Nonomuraea endophytica TaxID=714136 RepID=A0A7W8A8J3_9ACTN|nr:serine hydrolase domain-containing protein [Nonomuraea endophytica]MBB5081601.1 CubicO group peptidase (beta-lactamase class C family) [Nonomuraea endophytica]
MSQVEETTARALLRRLAVEQSECRVPSLAAAIVRDGQMVWFGGRGQVEGAAPTADTQYRLGSITKSMVAVLVMRLRDEGVLGLLDPVGGHVPGTPFDEVTIAQLLSHTGGLTAEPPTDWWERTPGLTAEDLFARIGPDEAKHRPGRTFHYSNVGYALLGRLITKHRGMSWYEALRREVLEPLGMNRTTLRPVAPHATGYAVHPWADVLLEEPEHDHVAMGPAGQLWSTAADLARWSAFLGGGGSGVLSAETLAEMGETTVVADGDAWVAGFGLGLQLARIDGRRLTGHGGSMPGFLAGVWADAKAGTGVLFLANTTSGVRYQLLNELLAILDEHEPRLPEEWRPVATDPALLALTGLWHWGPTPFHLLVLPDGKLSLNAVANSSRGSRFAPQADGTWLGLDGYYAGETLRVEADHLDLNTFILTREPYEQGPPIPGGAGEWHA